MGEEELWGERGSCHKTKSFVPLFSDRYLMTKTKQRQQQRQRQLQRLDDKDKDKDRKNDEVWGSCHKREPFVTTLQTNFLETLQTHIKVFRKRICCWNYHLFKVETRSLNYIENFFSLNRNVKKLIKGIAWPMIVKEWHPVSSKRDFKDKQFRKVTYQSICFKTESVSQCLRRIPFWVDDHMNPVLE